ncbi:hypothetical protein [Enterobacter asburiae]|uniref:hypothetical protein n=1 Tax=Enterobacter asburiae TaxID=61645 RepID=UPI003F55145D
MKKTTTVGALSLCALLSGCSHPPITVQATMLPSDARVQLWQIDNLPTTPVRIGDTTLTQAQLRQGVLIDNPDAALKALTGTHKPRLLDDSRTEWGPTITEQRNGPDNLLRADLYIYRLPAPQDILAYSFHASTTEPSENIATRWRSLHPELAIAYHPGKTLMIGDTVAPANKSALIAFITPTNR